MSGSGVPTALLVTMLLLDACGGQSTAEPLSAMAGNAPASGGASTSSDACPPAVTDGGCGGEAGDRALEPYARLRASCSRRTAVDRESAPVSIDCEIQ